MSSDSSYSSFAAPMGAVPMLPQIALNQVWDTLSPQAQARHWLRWLLQLQELLIRPDQVIRSPLFQVADLEVYNRVSNDHIPSFHMMAELLANGAVNVVYHPPPQYAGPGNLLRFRVGGEPPL